VVQGAPARHNDEPPDNGDLKMGEEMQLGLNLMASEALFDGDVSKVLEMVALADRKGADFVTISDHLGFSRSAHALRRQTNKFPFVLEQPWYEPISFLSAAAALTKRVRLSTFVLIAALRPTLLLAKQLATLDVISKGRVTIGLGVGWQEDEFRAAGMPFDGRFADLEDTIHAMRALWGPAPAKARGRNFSFEDFYSLPPPAQGAGLPILLGFKPTPRNLDRIARLAEGWAVDPAYRSIFKEKAEELRGLYRQHGRDPSKIEMHIGQGAIRTPDGAIDWTAVRAGFHAAAADGATTVTLMISDFCGKASEVEDFLDHAVALKA
jgi:probable F420-dependent oxidoreductase